MQNYNFWIFDIRKFLLKLFVYAEGVYHDEFFWIQRFLKFFEFVLLMLIDSRYLIFFWENLGIIHDSFMVHHAKYHSIIMAWFPWVMDDLPWVMDDGGWYFDIPWIRKNLGFFSKIRQFANFTSFTIKKTGLEQVSINFEKLKIRFVALIKTAGKSNSDVTVVVMSNCRREFDQL